MPQALALAMGEIAATYCCIFPMASRPQPESALVSGATWVCCSATSDSQAAVDAENRTVRAVATIIPRLYLRNWLAIVLMNIWQLPSVNVYLLTSSLTATGN